MAFDVALKRDQKRLAEAKARDLPIDHPLRARYLDWIHELDLFLNTPQIRSHSNHQMAGPSINAGPIGGGGDETAIVKRSRAEDVCAAERRQPVKAMSIARSIEPKRSTTPTPARPDTRKRGRAGSICDPTRQRLLWENQTLRNMLARYLRADR